ncbi:MAG: Sir2 family NAD-dependent protein deacetylase [Rhizobiales bacterium]|nr:Sir2 family NAD-dependent protein deacetylase [Hyphomicrobiales bacterium]
MVQSARRCVLFSGAGISTDCGVPDFRSPSGLWNQFQPIHFTDFLKSPDIRLEAWRRYFVIHAAFSGAIPGPAHRAVRELVDKGRIHTIITQNIDDLHRRSGIDPSQIIEVHGNGTFARCLSCEKRHELDWVREAIQREGAVPACLECGGLVKSATISFGQPMPDAEMAAARAASLDCDLFIAVGSSLQVYPAASLPIIAKHNRAGLVIINREPTSLDSFSDLVIHAELGDTLAQVAERID